jgi:hypothetical protein
MESCSVQSGARAGHSRKTRAHGVREAVPTEHAPPAATSRCWATLPGQMMCGRLAPPRARSGSRQPFAAGIAGTRGRGRSAVAVELRGAAGYSPFVPSGRVPRDRGPSVGSRSASKTHERGRAAFLCRADPSGGAVAAKDRGGKAVAPGPPLEVAGRTTTAVLPSGGVCLRRWERGGACEGHCCGSVACSAASARY